jgi:hypothetical protein
MTVGPKPWNRGAGRNRGAIHFLMSVPHDLMVTADVVMVIREVFERPRDAAVIDPLGRRGTTKAKSHPKFRRQNGGPALTSLLILAKQPFSGQSPDNIQALHPRHCGSQLCCFGLDFFSAMKRFAQSKVG